MKYIIFILIVFLLDGLGKTNGQDATVVVPAAYQSASPINYVRVWDVLAPQKKPNDIGAMSVNAARQTTNYLDGLGRPLQSVVKQGSLITGGSAVDFVTSTIYDSVGRERRQYLPFAASSFGGNTSISDGLFKLNPFQQQQNFYIDNNANSPINGQGETFYYSKKEYEASPLNRVNEILAAGNAWVNQGRGIETKYWLNTVTDAVRIWTVTDVANAFGTYATSTTYGVGQLFKTVIVDERGKQVVEFKDKENQLILKKVQLTATPDNGTGSGYTGWLCTYYIYDDLNRLRAVVQPRGVELLASNSWNINALSGDILSEQSFRYEYDARGRMTRKKVPGAGELYMIYDVRDRLVFTQDSNLRAQNKWLATLYDQFNRTVITGLLTYNSTASSLQSLVNTQTATPASPNTSIPLDLTLRGINQTGTKEALRTITMDSVFETTTSTTFTAQNSTIESGPDGETSVIDGIVINKNPLPSSAAFELLTATYYDDYNWCSDYPQINKNRNSSYDSQLLTASNTTFPFAQQSLQSFATRNAVTGSRIKVLNTETYLSSVNIYDDKGRIIQNQATNITGGTDIITSQYSFSGQPLVNVRLIDKEGTLPQTIVTVTKNTYDNLWREIKVEKKVAHSSINSGAFPSSFSTIVQKEYDAIGQLKIKKDGTKPATSSPLANLAYQYNIRGWLLNMNKSFIGSGSNNDQWFGMEIGYDKNASLGTFTPQYNGNLGGVIWKSQGDQEKRKYDFTYDETNRLTGASFNQYETGSGSTATFGKTAGIDFTVSGLTYDANGNIKTMVQKGMRGGASATIDSLGYTYLNNNNSNKLLNVIDGRNDALTKLGDFRTSNMHPNSGSKTTSTVDYSYDGNGNLVKDLNKDLLTYSNGNGLQYNHLNLPSLITVKKDASIDKGTIQYVYDAVGNKLRKIVTEGALNTSTLYLSGAEFKNDTLQYVAHEEGRIRFTPQIGASVPRFDYDYFIKDHLGNIRMVLSEQRKQDVYPAATLEGSLANSGDAVYVENQYYAINGANIVNRSQADDITYPNNNGNPPYNNNPNSNTTANSEKLYKLAATGSGGVTGLGMTLKVMSGDTINIFGRSYYPQNNGSGANYSIPVLNILSGLLGAPSGAAAGKGATAAGLNAIVPVYDAVNSFLGNASRGSGTTPKAYINWILFDENFRYVSGNFSRVGSAGTIKNHLGDPALQNILVTKNGYLYVYVSNESPVNVFFDNLQVVHSRGAMLEETHYYPFGLTMAGISSVRLGIAENKFRFNGIQQTNELETNQYDAFYRTLDPQIGRFWQGDPESEQLKSYSLYECMGNNPVVNVDPLGDFSGWFGAWWHRLWNGGGSIGQNEFGEWYVNKHRNSSVDDTPIVEGYRYYGEGRNQYSSAGEQRLIEDKLVNEGLFERVSSQREANDNNIKAFASVLLPNLLKVGTAATEVADAAKIIIKPEALNATVSFQKQARHLAGTAKPGGGFLNTVQDAQAVLDAVHSGQATYLGTTKAGHFVYRFEGVTGTNVNLGVGITNQPTNVFIIKGTASPSVVPTNPLWAP